MSKKHFLKTFLGFSILSLALAGCGGKNSHDDPRYKIYELAVSGGFSGTYEEWLETIKGEDGKDGKDGLTPYIGENGNWWIGDLDTGVPAKGKDASELNPQRLDFYPLDDGTFGIKAGKAIYLSEIDIPSTYLGKPVTRILPHAFQTSDPSYDVSVLKTINIPESIIAIDRCAFEYCQNLENIVIPESVASIDDFAFSGCDSLINVIVPENVTHMGYCAFDNNTVAFCIAEHPSDDWNKDWHERYDNNNSNIVWGYKGTIENKGLTYVLSSVDGNKTAILLDFDDSLTDVNVLETIGDGYKVTDYVKKVFNNRINLNSVVLPNGITNIYYYTFYGCFYLYSVRLGNYVTKIEGSAFATCTSLNSINIPDTVTYIGDNAFYGCLALHSIIIPESVTYIGYEAFYGCSGLTIYCEAPSKPEGWDSGWNHDNRPVVWGYTPNNQ